MPTSGVLDLAIGLVFVFAVTAAVSSAVTELISRFLGLRGAYLLTGLRELVDGGGVTTDLGQADQAYQAVQKMVRGDADAPAELPSMTSALLGGPILGSQGWSARCPAGRSRWRRPPRPGQACGAGWPAWSARAACPR
jgi:hypothetical protein